jgi:fructokinase
MRRTIDVLSAGELLVDFATAEFAQTLEEGTLFKRSPGGHAANLAVQMARLGNKAMLAATVGNDDLGKVLVHYLQRAGVDISCIAQVEEPTTLLLNTRSAAESNLQVYRAADALLSIRQFPFQDFDNIGVFHTTCFSMSKNPARQVIFQAAERAQRAACHVSLDINFSPKIFPDRIEAKKAVSEICRYKALVKITESDWMRLYEDQAPAPQAVIDHFLKIGASEVCFSNKEGCWVGNDDQTHQLPLAQDKTGEAFWAGYLTARLDGKDPLGCLTAARNMALQTGAVLEKVSRETLYEGIE